MNMAIKPFDWKDWGALWELRAYQLKENGIILDPVPSQPDLSSPYERDYHRIGQVYLSGAGGFWLAWVGDTPIGHIGGQDLGGVVELRRMYTRANYRRRGVGTYLVCTLVEHCATNDVRAIELWTARDGPGHHLYEKLGFRVTDGPGVEFDDLGTTTQYTPGSDEVRMRLDLSQIRQVNGE
jgi:GNAT superfamily N-acetyltransferase